jgi:26S proteasome regulatory subunit N7
MSVDSSTLHLSQNFHLAQFAATDALKKTALAKLMESVHKDEMAPFYSLLQARLDFPLDKTLLASLVAKNTATLAKLEEKAADELLGETEKSDALIAIADHYYKIGDKAAAEKAYDSAYEKTGPLGHRIDIVFSLVRIGFFFRDHELINKHIDSAKMYAIFILTI